MAPIDSIHDGQTAAIILAAGKSTRMKSDRPKVLHEVCGRSMLAYVIEACQAASIGRILVVVGHQKQAVMEAFQSAADVQFVEQAEQKGSGHAVQMTRAALAGFDGSVLVIAGDMPLVRVETLRELLDTHARERAAASLATTMLDEPAGYGRILRNDRGEFLGIVEERDCTETQRTIREVNPSYYCFECEALFEALEQVRPDNAKGEYYITDTLRILRDRGRRVVAATRVPPADATGINSPVDLAEVNRLMQRRLQTALMEQGVTIVAPELTWIESDAHIGADTIVHPFSFIGSEARIGRGCRIGPFATVARRAVVGDGRSVSSVVAAERSRASEAESAARALAAMSTRAGAGGMDHG